MELVFLLLTSAANLAVAIIKLIITAKNARKEKDLRSAKRKSH